MFSEAIVHEFVPHQNLEGIRSDIPTLSIDHNAFFRTQLGVRVLDRYEGRGIDFGDAVFGGAPERISS